MPRPVPVPIRKTILRLVRREFDAAAIAARVGRPPRTVRRLVARLRELGEEGLRPSYVSRPVNAQAFSPALKEEFVALRRQHPTWGSGYLRLRWMEEHQGRRAPSDRTIRTWLKEAGCRAPPARRPPSTPGRATAVHEVWQMDAADQKTLADGKGVCWLRLLDERSGAALKTAVFPPPALEPRRARRDEGDAGSGVR
jgi:hypothetical protein